MAGRCCRVEGGVPPVPRGARPERHVEHRLQGVVSHPRQRALRITDAHSRYVLACVIVLPRTDTVGAAGRGVFEHYGVPCALRSDNGVPFAGAGAGGLSRLSVEWVKAGIAVERIAPGQPQQNGRHERMHRTLKEEPVRPPAMTVEEQQARFDRFREDFNARRPHEALGQRPPAAFYRRSLRRYPERLEEPWYDADHAVRRVRSDGAIKWGGESVFVSETLKGETVGVAETAGGEWLVRFADLELGIIDRRRRSFTKATQDRNAVTHASGL